MSDWDNMRAQLDDTEALIAHRQDPAALQQKAELDKLRVTVDEQEQLHNLIAKAVRNAHGKAADTVHERGED